MLRFAPVPVGDPRQALRIKRYLLATGASLMVIGFMAVLYLTGYMAFAGFKWVSAAILASIVLFYALLRSGVNLKFHDPSLTTVQMISASMIITASAYFIKSEARDIVLPILLMIFYFGIFRLNTRQLTALALFNIACYGVLIALLYRNQPNLLDLKLELLRWAVLATVSLWFGTIGGHVTKLRRELAMRKEAIEALLERDDLTGVGNRRYLTHMLAREKSRADRFGTNFCVAMLDLDYFKKINDSYGHQAGDRVLITFARTVQAELRKIDYFGRYGGEEFTLIMSDTRLDGAVATAERLRKIIEQTAYPDIDPKLVQTVSIGVTQYQKSEDTGLTLLRADKAMYKAKATGRNRVQGDAAL